MGRPHGKFREPPVERTPPFLLVPDGETLVLVSPFPKRRAGPTLEQRAIVQAKAKRLRHGPFRDCSNDNSGATNSPGRSP